VNIDSNDSAKPPHSWVEERCSDPASPLFEEEFNHHYGLLIPNQTVLIRAYSHDSDDQMLIEIMPKFIIMVEPNEDFIRRIEVSFKA
jgi:DNA excision repair protein ERCC-4